MGLSRKKHLTSTDINSGPSSNTNTSPSLPLSIGLKCGCTYLWVERTNQTILYPGYECSKNHRAEIVENVSKEDWENLLKVNAALGPQSEGIQFMGSSGLMSGYPPHNQGGNTP